VICLVHKTEVRTSIAIEICTTYQTLGNCGCRCIEFIKFYTNKGRTLGFGNAKSTASLDTAWPNKHVASLLLFEVNMT